MSQRALSWSLLLLAWIAGPARAEEFYVDPAAGSGSGDGSRDKPWQTLEAVVKDAHIGKEIHPGDTVWLRSGYHGVFNVKGGTYAPPISVAAEAGQAPQLSRASFAQTHGWVLRGVALSPSFAASAPATTIVQIDKSSSEITVQGCELFSVADAANWTADQWINAASSGAQISGDHSVFSHNRLENVRFGISVDGPNALIEYNSVLNFSADGMRGLGDNAVFQYNLVKNVYVSQDDGDDNHDDGFQSWSNGPDGPGSGVVKGVVLRGNVIINREDPQQKFPNSLQGIGCFDGFYDDWVVENNVVATDHWHGISLYGMRGGRIVNNTVIDINDTSPGPPWIMVNAHKDGTKSQRVLVRNNLATDYSLDGDALVTDHNTTLKDLGPYFVSRALFDLHLLPNAPAIDQGSSDSAPALDADRIPRPQGVGVDLGAYEWHAASVLPEDAGRPAAGEGGSKPAAGSGGRAGGAASGQTTAGASGGASPATGGSSGSDAAASGGAAQAGGAAGSRHASGCACRVTGAGLQRAGGRGASAASGLGSIALLAVALVARGRKRSLTRGRLRALQEGSRCSSVRTRLSTARTPTPTARFCAMCWRSPTSTSVAVGWCSGCRTPNSRCTRPARTVRSSST
jgi:hypothetical protein